MSIKTLKIDTIFYLSKQPLHNFAEKYVKILDICKKFAGNLVNEHGNMPRRGVVPRFSDLEVIALSITAECLSIDSENYLLTKK